MMALPRQPVTDAVQTMLATVTEFPCGVGSIPLKTDGRTPEDLPFLVLDPLPARFDGTWSDRTSSTEWPYQVRCVGARHDQAQRLWDRACAAVYDTAADGSPEHPLDIDGQREEWRGGDPEGGNSGGPADGIVTLVLRFQITTTGA